MHGIIKSSLVKVTEEGKVNVEYLHMFLAGDAKIQIWRIFTTFLKAEFPGHKLYLGYQACIYQLYSPKFSGK